MRLSLGGLAIALFALAACAAEHLDPIAGYVVRNPISFPAPTPSYSQQIVTLVGPPGTRSCGLLFPSEGKYEGQVDADNSVTILLPPLHFRGGYQHGYWPITAYRCWVVSPEFPRGRYVQRVIHDIQLPQDAAKRQLYFEQLLEARRRGCPEIDVAPAVIHASMFCGIGRADYGSVDLGAQPSIIHLGRRADIDMEAASARWQSLRAALTERCRTESSFRCDWLDDGTWDLLEGADLQRTFDARNSDN